MKTPDLSPLHLQQLLPALVDIVLVLDKHLTVLEVTVLGKDLQRLDSSVFKGRSLNDFVSHDSKDKFALMLAAVGKKDAPAWRHVNFSPLPGQDLPLQVSLVPQEKDGIVWLFGRDLSGLSQM